MRQKNTKNRAGRPKTTTIAEDNFIKVTSLHDRMLTAPNIIAQLNHVMKKCVKINDEKTVKLAYMAELQSC